MHMVTECCMVISLALSHGPPRFDALNARKRQTLQPDPIYRKIAMTLGLIFVTIAKFRQPAPCKILSQKNFSPKTLRKSLCFSIQMSYMHARLATP